MSMDDDLEVEAEEVGEEWPLSPEETSLLYPSIDLEYRAFRVTNSNSTIFGVLLRETEDSFLVALPASIKLEEDNSQVMVPIIPSNVSVARFLKSNIFIVANLIGPSLEAYKSYLEVVAPELYPDLIEELGLDVKGDSEEEDEFLEEIEQKVEDAILNGSFIRGSSDTVH